MWTMINSFAVAKQDVDKELRFVYTKAESLDSRNVAFGEPLKDETSHVFAVNERDRRNVTFFITQLVHFIISR